MGDWFEKVTLGEMLDRAAERFGTREALDVCWTALELAGAAGGLRPRRTGTHAVRHPGGGAHCPVADEPSRVAAHPLCRGQGRGGAGTDQHPLPVHGPGVRAEPVREHHAHHHRSLGSHRVPRYGAPGDSGTRCLYDPTDSLQRGVSCSTPGHRAQRAIAPWHATLDGRGHSRTGGAVGATYRASARG